MAVQPHRVEGYKRKERWSHSLTQSQQSDSVQRPTGQPQGPRSSTFLLVKLISSTRLLKAGDTVPCQRNHCSHQVVSCSPHKHQLKRYEIPLDPNMACLWMLLGSEIQCPINAGRELSPTSPQGLCAGVQSSCPQDRAPALASAIDWGALPLTCCFQLFNVCTVEVLE